MDYTEHDVERLLKENEQELLRLAGAAGELRRISGQGESRSGLTKAVVDADGRLQSVLFQPRVLRLDVAGLAEEVVQAVQRAQEDQDRQARELLGAPVMPVGLDEIHRQFADLHEGFRGETAERNQRLRHLGDQDPYD